MSGATHRRWACGWSLTEPARPLPFRVGPVAALLPGERNPNHRNCGKPLWAIARCQNGAIVPMRPCTLLDFRQRDFAARRRAWRRLLPCRAGFARRHDAGTQLRAITGCTLHGATLASTCPRANLHTRQGGIAAPRIAGGGLHRETPSTHGYRVIAAGHDGTWPQFRLHEHVPGRTAELAASRHAACLGFHVAANATLCHCSLTNSQRRSACSMSQPSSEPPPRNFATVETRRGLARVAELCEPAFSKTHSFAISKIYEGASWPCA